ncbi:hypothetical protein [Longispora albida]|uniref:hypothetical protein n=1 Tax=Longispora albida TaxID=203523 RepID=UPI0003A12AE0|nr:hypothetical protein [Longispora albida]
MSDFDKEAELHGLFAAFRSESIEEVTPAGMTAVQSTVRHQRKVRNIALSALAMIMVAAPAAAFATLDTGEPHAPPAQNITASAVPEPDNTPEYSPQPAPTASASSQPPVSQVPPPDPRSVDLKSATITMPVWPGGAQITDTCKAGPYTFKDGSALIAKQTTWDDFTYVLGTPVYAELDGQPGDEILVRVTCTGAGSFHPVFLLGLKPTADKKLNTLGPVVPAQNGRALALDSEDLRVSARTVEVSILGHYSTNGAWSFKQARGYRYDNGAFRQVSGPAGFPAPPTAIDKVDFRNTSLSLGCQSSRCAPARVQFVNGTGQDMTSLFNTDRNGERTFQYSVGSVTQASNGIAFVTVSRTSEKYPAEARTSVYAVRLGTDGIDGNYLAGWEVVATGMNELPGAGAITGIVSQQAKGADLEVVVTTAAGQQTLLFRAKHETLWEIVK